MAVRKGKKTKQQRPRRREPERESLPTEFSLEEILAEYRSVPSPEPEPLPAPESREVRMTEEADGVLSAAVPETEGPSAPEEPAPAPADVPPARTGRRQEPAVPPQGAPLYAAHPPRPDLGPGPLTEEEVFSEMFSPEDLMREETIAHAWDDPSRREPEAPALESEGYEDEDFYAGPVTPPETEDAEPEDGETRDESGEAASAPRRTARGGRVRPAGGIWDRITALLAVVSLRREQRRSQPAPEPENNDKEMAPDKAARHYAGQRPALKLRTVVAAGVCLLLVWITLGCGFGGGLPGRLAEDIRLASLVALVGEITVMLVGLDVVTAGIMSLLRGRPGAESMIVLSSLASVLDTAVIAATGNDSRGLPFGAIPAVATVFALWGGWHISGAYHDTFLALFHAPEEPFVVTAEELSEKKGRVLIKSRRDTAGFIRRSEEPGAAETLAGAAFLPLAAAALALSLAAALGGGDPGAFFHVFSLMTALCCAFGWLFSFPALYSRAARRLMLRGSAIAGWSGIRDAGKSGRLVLTDTDIFPEDTVEITGVRLLDKSRAQEIISCTGSMLSAAGTGTASVFTELMRRQKAVLQPVEDFTVGEGGCRGTIKYQEYRVGTLGYMHLSGVKIPDKLRVEDALYTAEGGELVGVFLYRYRPMASVQRALFALRKARRRPIFAVRDFNLDPLLLRRKFGVSTEGFEFPPFAERYRISGTPAGGKSPVAGVIAQDGLEALVDISECGTQLYQLGQVCAWACLVSTVLGAALLIGPCWLGRWSLASAAWVLIYMLVWLLPTLAARLLVRK